MEDRQYLSLLMSLAVLEANFGREDTKHVQEGEGARPAKLRSASEGRTRRKIPDTKTTKH